MTHTSLRRHARRWVPPLASLAIIAVCALAYGLPRTASPPRPVPNHAFLSAAVPDPPAVVWAIGDGADGSDTARALARRIAADRPDRLLYLGDVYDRGSAADFRERYDTVYGPLVGITAPAPGNHDWPAHRDGYDPYWRAQTGARTPPWYKFRLSGWRIISLNSEAPHGHGTAQLRWLRHQMSRASGTCTLAFWHRPLMSAGDHGDQPDVAPLWNALRGKASLVLNGHDHDLQRMHPRDGIVELVAGAGGMSHYSLDDDKRRAFGDDRHDGALRLELRPVRAKLSFVSTNGEVLDRSSVRCSPPP